MGDGKNVFLLPKVIKGKKKAPLTLDIKEEKRMLLNGTATLETR